MYWLKPLWLPALLFSSAKYSEVTTMSKGNESDDHLVIFATQRDVSRPNQFAGRQNQITQYTNLHKAFVWLDDSLGASQQ